jgi:elongation factor Ts
MNINASLVKELRDKTGAGMMDCKKSLVHSNGDIEKAIDYLRKTGVSKAEKKGSRDTKEGLVYSYIHAGGKLGVIIELNCETDFVASTDRFRTLAHDLSMHIAATNPISINKDSIDQSIIDREKNIYTEQAKSEGKPENIIEKMVNGRISKFYQESCLLEQTFIKDQEKKIADLLTESISKLGENITIRRFIRYAIGEHINFNKSYI